MLFQRWEEVISLSSLRETPTIPNPRGERKNFDLLRLRNLDKGPHKAKIPTPEEKILANDVEVSDLGGEN